MFRKRFFVKIELKLHTITCPGVWLCKHGFLEATVKTLGYILRTGAMEPRFPLLAHDEFTLEGYFKSVGSMDELERLLSAEKVEITLWQNGRRLAYLTGKLADIMQKDMLPNCGHDMSVQLLMKATPAFPGIIAPKVELSANVGVRDRLGSRSRSKKRFSGNGSATSVRSANYSGDFVVPKFTPKSLVRRNRHMGSTCSEYLDAPRRQQPVCHTRHFSSESLSMSSSGNGSSENMKVGLSIEGAAMKHKNTQRRLSDSSGQSFILSRCSTSFSEDGSYYCTHSGDSEQKLYQKDEDHQEYCKICQEYRRAFLTHKI